MDPYKIINILKPRFPEIKKTGNRWVNFNCPFCHQKGFKQDTKLHFGINYQKGYTNCFRCGTQYKLIYFLKIIYANFDNDDFIFDEAQFVSTKTVIKFPKEYINALDLFDPRYPTYITALEYIDKRIGIDLALELNIGFCYTGTYANRIVVPVFDIGGNIIYFVARAIHNFMNPKILNPPGEKGPILFNWNTAQNFSEIYISEGVFSAITTYPYGIATLGKEVTDEQLFAIIKSDIKIINILLDGNAIKNAYRLADRILSYTSKFKIRVLELRKEYQPDDFDLPFILSLRNNTKFYQGNLFL